MAAASRARRSRASSRASGSSAAEPPKAERASSGPRLVGRSEPALAARARLAAIETAVDENAREPDLERPGLAVRADVAEDLDEGVLHGLVGVGGVAKILIGDPEGATLMPATRAR